MKKILVLFVAAFLTAGSLAFFSCKDNDTESDDIHVEVESAPSAADLAGTVYKRVSLSSEDKRISYYFFESETAIKEVDSKDNTYTLYHTFEYKDGALLRNNEEVATIKKSGDFLTLCSQTQKYSSASGNLYSEWTWKYEVTDTEGNIQYSYKTMITINKDGALSVQSSEVDSKGEEHSTSNSGTWEQEGNTGFIIATFKGEDGEEGKAQLFYDGTNLYSAYKLVQETDESVIKAVKAAAEE